MYEVELSIVAPLHNEVATLEELVRRCSRVAADLTDHWEIILVDDASSDGTTSLLKKVADSDRIHGRFLETQHGQFAAVRAGLLEARGQAICVLDGDLQDPPEVIRDLWYALRSAPEVVSAVFGTKASRDEPLAFRIGERAFHSLQFFFGAKGLPRGSSSFAIFRASAARAIAETDLPGGNLASVLALLGARAESVPYARHGRYDGVSRLGPAGHIREALHALHHSGAIARIFAATSIGFLALGWMLASHTKALGSLLGLAATSAAAYAVLVWHRSVLKKKASGSVPTPQAGSAASRRSD